MKVAKISKATFLNDNDKVETTVNILPSIVSHNLPSYPGSQRQLNVPSSQSLHTPLIHGSGIQPLKRKKKHSFLKRTYLFFC
jgi:hypothetical protein